MTRRFAQACALLPFTVSAWARADPPGATTEVVVDLAAVDLTTTASMTERLRAVGTRLGVSTRIQSRARIDARDVLAEKRADAAIVARVWLDLSDPKRAVLYIANAAHDRFLVRVVPADDGYGELTQESLTTIVESVVDALVAGGQIGVDREEATRAIEDVGVRVEPEPPSTPVAPTAAPPPAAAPSRDEGVTTSPEERRLGLRSVVDLSYRADIVADGLSVRQGPQVALSVTGFNEKGLDGLLWLAGHFAPSSTLGDTNEKVQLRGGGGRAAAGATRRIGTTFAFRAAVGAGVDVFGVQATVAPESGLVADDGTTIVVPIATAFLGGSFQPAHWLEVPFSLGVDVDLSSHHFDAQNGERRMVLVQPWVAHPYATIGLGVPVTP